MLTITKPAQHLAERKQEKARTHVAMTEVRLEIIAYCHQELDVSVNRIQSQLCTEPRPLSILSVSSQTTTLTKETPCLTNVKQQRAQIQNGHNWNIRHSLNITDTQTLEEGHTISLKTDENLKPEMKTESKIFQNAVSIEEKATVNENCSLLEVSEQDFAVQIQEGQSVRQSVLLVDQRVMTGEQLCEV